jgi:hypothetical protein
MGPSEGIAQARRRAAAPARAAEGEEQEEEGAPGPSRTPTVPRKRKAPGTDAAEAAVAAAVGRGARRGRLFPREEEKGKGKAAAPAEEEEEEVGAAAVRSLGTQLCMSALAAAAFSARRTASPSIRRLKGWLLGCRRRSLRKRRSRQLRLPAGCWVPLRQSARPSGVCWLAAAASRRASRCAIGLNRC